MDFQNQFKRIGTALYTWKTRELYPNNYQKFEREKNVIDDCIRNVGKPLNLVGSSDEAVQQVIQQRPPNSVRRAASRAGSEEWANRNLIMSHSLHTRSKLANPEYNRMPLIHAIILRTLCCSLRMRFKPLLKIYDSQTRDILKKTKFAN